MKPINLTISETLIKERADQKAHELAKTYLENQTAVLPSDLIAAAIAIALPHITDPQRHESFYNMLMSAAAGSLSTEAQLRSTLSRVKDLHSQLDTKLEAELEQENAAE
ncbi:hypothetical protein [Vibrio harveyi]|uniref:hypothetical protein n=1 Tax=Vibrio harveyi TaxID=669 RepID=UPI0025AFC4DA|nr:hypothetical protein [Vibrio harveyi]WJT09256.1 hypothetical protein PH545_24835 [Vibrio harveyi]